jgi:hypothetical protein
MREFIFAISSTAFAVIFLVAIIAFGGPLAQSVAVLVALMACLSQFTAQDPKAYRFSIYSAYVAFALAVFAYLAFVWAR